MDTIRQQRIKALKIIYSFGVKFLKKEDFDIARQAFEIVIRESDEEEKEEFLSRIFKGASLRAKAEQYLKEITLRQARAEEKLKTEALPRVQTEAEKRKEEQARQKREEENKKRQEKRKKLQEQARHRGKQVEERKHLRREELRLLFEKALDCYNRNEIEFATKLSEILLKELEEEKKKAGFIEKIAMVIPLIHKTNNILNKVQKKRKEEEIRKRQMQRLKEAEEIIKKQREYFKKPEDIERQKEELIKRHEEGLKSWKDEIAKKYEKELEKQMNELFQKQKELKAEERELEKLEDDFERRKSEIKKRHEQEFEAVKKVLEDRRAEELTGWEEKLKTEEIRKKHESLRREEELKSRATEEVKFQDVPEEPLVEKEDLRKREDILKEEEEIREKRKLIEEETRRMEEEETRRKQTEEGYRQPAGGEEAKGEKEKRRVWLKEAIEKEKETMGPEAIEKEQKGKIEVLKTGLNEAIFHYKEKNFERAIEVFQELKKKLPEPEKEPGFFSRIFGKIPLYNIIEDYISKIEKEKILEEKKKVKQIRESAKIAAGEKRRAKYQPFSKIRKEIGKRLPASPLVILKKFLFLPPLVAIDISDYSIEILRLNKKLSILSYGRSTIKEGVVSEGEIKDQKELSLVFKLAVNQAGFKPFKPRLGPILRGIVSVPEYKTIVQVFSFDLKDNIFEKVKEEIKKTIPFPIEDLYWDYTEYRDEKTKQIKVLCAAALKDVINEQVYFLKSVGIEPVIFDVEAASVGRTLLPEKYHSDKAGIIILDIGDRVTNINIFDETGFIDASTAIPIAGRHLIDKISEYFGVSKEEAEAVMGIKGFRKEDNVILEILEKGMERIIKETKEAAKHYQKRTGNIIERIILSGGIALLPDIDNFFRDHFQDIEIEIGDPLKRIKRKGGIDSDRAILFANCLGLALRSIARDPVGEGINLLPGKIKEKEKKFYWQRHRQKRIIIQIILIILIAITAFLIYFYLYV